MKKSLVALAVMAAAGAASAQSSVTIYGILDVGYTRNSGNVFTSKGLSNSTNGLGSRLGFRGVEDLGGGLKAGFVLETGIQNDSGAGQINPSTNNLAASSVPGSLQFGRLSYVNLAGGFGEVRLGRDIVPSYYNDVVYDPFGGLTVAAGLNTVGSFITVGATNLRVSNGIHYFTPNTFGGFFAHLAYAIGENPSNAGVTEDDGEYAGLRVGYAAGPLSVALAAGKTTVTHATGVSNDRKQANFGGTYDLGVAKIFANYTKTSQDHFGAAANPDLNTKGYLLGVTAPVGPGLVRASFSKIKNSDLNNFESKKFGIGYQYNLSKRTALFATVARITNSGRAAGDTALTTAVIPSAGNLANLGVGAGSSLGNAKTNGYDIGLRHSF
jgi:predicted porin